ncbi:MAG: hypothetical protein F4Y20_08770 [Acidobacteria bacterium]|nr:hypothetical protein [Acidobacteriota bacterium]MYA46335.1 hypothetical protein [Acidobacteriota bacterium]MYB32591.1 hypothetical protein [Acidobacteriota bacterium]MYH20939.1 hypothetical protein [Acidobacteriota bacterium]MYI37604.1 hypothetical protein [Acidobacteriota bacterium]
MKTFASLSLVFGIVLAPMHAHAAAIRAPGAAPSLLEAAEIAAASGVYRAQNTAGIATGRIREDDNRRSAIAFALSGLLAFTGAALWRNLTCRDGGDARHFGEGLKTQTECFEEDGSRKGWSTPTKALFGAGVGLELVSLFYLVRHLREDGQQDDAQPSSP